MVNRKHSPSDMKKNAFHAGSSYLIKTKPIRYTANCVLQVCIAVLICSSDAALAEEDTANPTPTSSDDEMKRLFFFFK